MLDGVEHKSHMLHPWLNIKRGQAACRVRKYYIIGGIHGIPRTLKINNASIDTLCAALLERMYYCKVGDQFVEPPSCDSRYLRQSLGAFRRKLLVKIGRVDSKLTPKEFVSLFRGRKAAIYNSYLDEFYSSGVLRKHSVSAAFVKCEKVNPTKAPRCIQPRHPVYNIGLGCYLKHLEHRIYRAIGRVYGDTDVVVKGYDVGEVGNILYRKWSEFNDPIGIGLDAVKFDMHVSAPMLEWEHSIYQAIYRGDKELKRLLSYQINNRGVGYCEDGSLRYHVLGRRFSGDMNTSLGNCIIMCAMVYSYASSINLNIRLANNGDDCMVFMERDDASKFNAGLVEYFFKLGFRMTVEPIVDVFERVEFCNMRPIAHHSGHVMVRNFNAAREKDSICLLPLQNAVAMRKWLHAIGECGLALCSGIPVMQSLYACYIRNGIASNAINATQMECGMLMLRKNMVSKFTPISADSRVSFMLAWDLTPDEQVALENYYQNLDLVFSNDHDVCIDDISFAPY